MFIEMATDYEPRLGPVIDTVSTTLLSYVNPLISVKWGQCFPEGLYFPNTVAGCNNTATALVTSYFEYPTYLPLTYDYADTTVVTLNWSAMKQHIKGSNSYALHTGCNATVEAHKNIGRLVRQIARFNRSQFYYHNSHLPWNTPLPYSYTDYVVDPYVSMTYTTTYNIYRLNALDTLGYTHTTPTTYTTKCTQSYLNNHWLVLMFGEAISPLYPDPVGHSWVVDGYKYYQYVIVNYNLVNPVPQTTYSYYNHINWGWDGDSNGYFLDGVFAAHKAKTYDSSQHSSTYSFYNLEITAVHL